MHAKTPKLQRVGAETWIGSMHTTLAQLLMAASKIEFIAGVHTQQHLHTVVFTHSIIYTEHYMYTQQAAPLTSLDKVSPISRTTMPSWKNSCNEWTKPLQLNPCTCQYFFEISLKPSFPGGSLVILRLLISISPFHHPDNKEILHSNVLGDPHLHNQVSKLAMSLMPL